jgi:hypothetical protein
MPATSAILESLLFLGGFAVQKILPSSWASFGVTFRMKVTTETDDLN